MKSLICEKGIFFIVIIYLFFYIFNFLTPMGFGDDYLYSFVWQGKPEFIPLTNNAERISSVHDLFVSQWSHYFTWSGRTVNHTLAQFFLWMGKDFFNVFNAFITTLLILEIYWCINKGKITYYFQLNTIWGIFIALWAFTPGYVTVFLWLDGACNYLWTSVMLLGFMLPYIQKFYSPLETIGKGDIFSFMMFAGGILTGWTNENSICWILLVISVYLFIYSKKTENEMWMYCGLAGLMIGYMLLILAPGNISRMLSVHGVNEISIYSFKNGFHNFLNSFFKVIIHQFLMCYFCFRALQKLKKVQYREQEMGKDILMVKVFFLLLLGCLRLCLYHRNFHCAVDFQERFS